MPTQNKPSLLKALKLKCPYCGETSMIEKGNIFKYASGCEKCDYKFERDASYYSGANQLIGFPVAGTLGLIIAACLYAFSDLNLYFMIGLVFGLMILFIIAFWPFTMALWLWMDHKFNKLNENDSLRKES